MDGMIPVGDEQAACAGAEAVCVDRRAGVAVLEGMNFIGAELSAEYAEIARARIHRQLRKQGLFSPLSPRSPFYRERGGKRPLMALWWVPDRLLEQGKGRLKAI